MANTFLTSDLHLDHENIIMYCNRPFKSKKEMNETLIRNWNNAITNDDTVYFLGDMAFGRHSRNLEYWLTQLKGNIILIKGNHDRSKTLSFLKTKTINHQGYTLHLIHDPSEALDTWGGWIVHGHVHNNNPKKYPYINRERKTVNVSVEVTGYKPVNLEDLIRDINSA